MAEQKFRVETGIETPEIEINGLILSASATTLLVDGENIATQAYADQAVASLVDSAPGLLDTLNEIAAALGDDENFATSITSTIASASANSLSYTDEEIGSLESSLITTIATASGAAVTSANGYTDGEIATSIVTASTAAAGYADGLAVNYDSAGSAASAQTAAESYADGIVATSIVTASTAAASYTDQAVSNLVDTAPEVLNTLNELAAALGDDENFATTISSTIGTASANALSYTDQEIGSLESSLITTIATASGAAVTSANGYTDGEVLSGIVSASVAAVTSANAYTDGEIGTLESSLITTIATASGAAVTSANGYTDGEVLSGIVSASVAAVTSANAYTDGEINSLESSLITTIATASGAAVTSAEGYTDQEIGALTTTDISEGTNLYFTDQRAEDAVSDTIASASVAAFNAASAYIDQVTASVAPLSYVDSIIDDVYDLIFDNEVDIEAISASISTAIASASVDASTLVGDGLVVIGNNLAVDQYNATVQYDGTALANTVGTSLKTKVHTGSTTSSDTWVSVATIPVESTDAVELTIHMEVFGKVRISRIISTAESTPSYNEYGIIDGASAITGADVKVEKVSTNLVVSVKATDAAIGAVSGSTGPLRAIVKSETLSF